MSVYTQYPQVFHAMVQLLMEKQTDPENSYLHNSGAVQEQPPPENINCSHGGLHRRLQQQDSIKLQEELAAPAEADRQRKKCGNC